MSIRRISPWLAASIVLLAATQTKAQESPDDLTKGEWQCVRRTAREAVGFAGTAADCILECREAAKTDPLRFSGFYKTP